MKEYKGVIGSSDKPLYVGLTTVYIRSNFKPHETLDEEGNVVYRGWEYDEIQMPKDEYIEILMNKKEFEKIEENFLNPDDKFMKVNDDEVTFDELKSLKLQQLKYLCSETIYNGFTTTLGYTFGFNELDQSNFTQMMVLIVANGGQYNEPIHWKTKNEGVVELTVVEFLTVINEATIHKQNVQNKFWELEKELNECESKKEILEIKW